MNQTEPQAGNCRHQKSRIETRRGGWHRATCPECGYQGRWRRSDSAAQREMESMIALAAPPPDTSIRGLLDAVAAEVTQAEATWPPMNSAHEAYGVLLEEVDELWAHVKTKQSRRDLPAMRKEALQVAAMAIRFARDVCTEERGRK